MQLKWSTAIQLCCCSVCFVVVVVFIQQLALCCLQYCQSRYVCKQQFFNTPFHRIASHSPTEMNEKNQMFFRKSQQFGWRKKQPKSRRRRSDRGKSIWVLRRKKMPKESIDSICIVLHISKWITTKATKALDNSTFSQYKNKVHNILYFNIAGGYAFPITFPVNNSCNWSLRHIENVNSCESRFPAFCLSIKNEFPCCSFVQTNTPYPSVSPSGFYSCSHRSHIIICASDR